MKYWQAIGICVIYFFICFVGIQSHELWLDEAHHILLGRNSHSFSELIYNSRYEGHPLLWNILVYVIMHVFNDVFYIQVFHIILSSVCVYLILKHAPFPVIVKFLITFGYFMIYEYSVITRHYSLALLLMLLFLVEYSPGKKRFIVLSVIIALLCNVHIFSVMIAFGFVLILYKDWMCASNLVKIVSSLILFFGIIICLAHVIPPQDHFLKQYNQEAFLSMKRFTRTVWVPLKGMLPLPDFFEVNYWNTNFFINTSKGLAFVMSLFAFIAPGIIFGNNRKAFLLFYIPLFGIMLFFYATPLMLTTRNCGYVSILFLIAYWIKCRSPETILFSANCSSEVWVKRISLTFVNCILILQFMSGVIVYWFDIQKDFSSSKKAATYINYHINLSAKILVSHQSAAPALVCYVYHPLVYLETEAIGSFCSWNNRPFINNDSLLLKKIERQIKDVNEAYLVLNTANKMNELLKANSRERVLDNLGSFKMAEFSNAVVSSENYYVYKIK